MAHASYVSEFPVPAAELFAWHMRPGAFERMNAPWEPVEIVDRGRGVALGSRVALRMRLGPLRKTWISEHVEFEPGRLFRDRQISGPFRSFDHTHLVVPRGVDSARLEDRIEYTLPLGALGQRVAGRFVRSKLDRMFAYRHRTLAADLERHARTRTLSVAISGAGGMVGRALATFLTSGGHAVTRLLRPGAPADDLLPSVRWDPARGLERPEALSGLDAVVHLAGAGIAGRRWSPAWKRAIRDSRVEPTQRLAEQLAALADPPRAFVCASAVGVYGDRGDEELDESSPPGSGFLAAVGSAWERATEPAAAAGMRVVKSTDAIE